jgi:hypothetical protein
MLKGTIIKDFWKIQPTKEFIHIIVDSPFLMALKKSKQAEQGKRVDFLLSWLYFNMSTSSTSISTPLSGFVTTENKSIMLAKEIKKYKTKELVNFLHKEEDLELEEDGNNSQVKD